MQISLAHKVRVIVPTIALSLVTPLKANAQDELIQPVKMLTINNLNRNSRAFPGLVDAKEKAVLSFRVYGQLNDLKVRSGQKVTKGQVLATLDPIDYQLEFDIAQAQYRLAEINYQRSVTLSADQLVSESQVDIDKSEMDTRQAEAEQRQADIDYTQLKAPYDGVISKLNVENHQYVHAKQSVMNIQSEHLINISFQLPETIVKRLNAEIKNTTKPQVQFSTISNALYPAEFSEVDTQADPNTLSYKVTLAMEKPTEFGVLPGMSVNVVLESQKRELIKIPHHALIKPRDNEQNSVWLFDKASGTVSEREVTIVNQGRSNVEVINNFENGDKVVLTGLNKLSKGMKVREWIRERGL